MIYITLWILNIAAMCGFLFGVSLMNLIHQWRKWRRPFPGTPAEKWLFEQLMIMSRDPDLTYDQVPEEMARIIHGYQEMQNL